MSCIFAIIALNYNLRSETEFFSNTVNTTKFGLNSLRHFLSKVWSIIPIEIKNSSSVEMIKNKTSKWEPNECCCKLCQYYLHRIGMLT